MDENYLERRLAEIESKLRDLRREFCSIPWQRHVGGGASLPRGQRYQVLMVPDDDGTLSVCDWPRIHQ